MSKIMLINVTHAEESRVGIVEDGQLESFEIESLSREHLKGNIYKGIVRRIHPAIEAAFVDIGAGRDAFLPLDEICFRNLPAGRNGAGGDKTRRRIKDLLKSGDEILVQIVKEQFTSKPPTLSTFFSLPGRYLVLLPGSEDAGISRKIEGEERARLRAMIARLEPPPGCGIIVRTAAGFDEETAELERDLNYLQRLWESIRKHGESKRAPALVYREHDLVLRNIRDYFTPDIDEIFIDNDEVYERARDFLHNVMPGKEHVLHLYQGEQPIFSRFQVEGQIESIYKRRVQLKSGGSIVIDGTEALTAIDVNSGGSMRGGSQEDTAYRTNLEAAAEIARQLRLRDLGGIIVIDFIDMRLQSHVNEVEKALREAMRADKARHDIGHISRLGLLEISRQRLRPAAAASSYTACPMCEGHGAIRTTESAALVALRKVHNRIAEGDVGQMKVSLPRDVAMYLLNQKRDDLAVLEARYVASIQVVVSDKLMPHQCEIEVRTRDVAERPVPVARPGELAPADVVAASDGARRQPAARRAEYGRAATASGRERAARAGAQAPAASEGAASTRAEGGEGRPRRRRRRGGRGRKEAAGAARGPVPAAAGDGEDAGGAAPPRPDAIEPVVPERQGLLEFASATDATLPPAAEPRWEAEAAAVVEGPAEVVPATPAARAPAPATPPEDPPAGMVPEPVDEEWGAETGAPASAAAPAEPAGESGDAAVSSPPAAGGVDAATVSPPRRRRRRGGKRGGRGRRSGAGSETADAVGLDTPPGGGVANGDAPGAAGSEAPVGGETATPARRPRRRRGGARRRRAKTHAEATGPPLEPPVNS